ncbi:hypothetical protein M422DRAFT_238337 [Sphaerobolus stellatus SS14]|nr:hypothetical protein M422DRAFT_238337 [Sphaerobolus stellatus SS14]
MSRISDISSKLGEYMLKGYILTDEGCPKCLIPMLRTPASQAPQRLFCSQCPEEEDVGSSSKEKDPVESISGQSTTSTEASSASTPLTEISTTSALSSPTFAPVPDPQLVAHRRAQSDMASAEIGRRMLQGWAMLAEECPNPTCYGVPLVRPPKAGGEKDPRKECVVCHTVYVFETNEYGQNILVPQISQVTPTASVPAVIPVPQLMTAPPRSSSSERNVNRATPPSLREEPVDNNANLPEPEAQTHLLHEISTISTLAETISSLELSLHALSSRLASLSSQIPLDHVKIGEVASSIQHVTDALRTVKFLHFQERSG